MGPSPPPLPSLPNEILAEIFIHCLPPPVQSSTPAFAQPNTQIAPLLLCRICSLWRMIAIHTPALWTSLTLTLEYASLLHTSTSGFPAQKLACLSLWSDRCGVLPPSLALRRYHTRIVYDKKDSVVSVGRFFAHGALRAARTLDLGGFSELDLKTLSGAVDEFPNLTNLVVQQPGGREHNLKRLRFPRAPLLRRLYFDCFVENATGALAGVLGEEMVRAMFAPSWARLTHLAVNLEMNVEQWRVIPRECTSLRHLAVNIRLLPPPPPAPGANLAPLTSQTTNGPGTSASANDVPLLTCPHLVTLTIQASSPPPPLPPRIHPNLNPTNTTLNAPPQQQQQQQPVLTSPFDPLFHKTHFPALRCVRLSSSTGTAAPTKNNTTTLETLHRVLSTMPQVREVHLKGALGCLGLGRGGFGAQGGGGHTSQSHLPSLRILVIDGIVNSGAAYVPLGLTGGGSGNGSTPTPGEDIVRLVRSEWLNAGWEDEDGDEGEEGEVGENLKRSKSRRRIEFILNFGRHFSESVIEEVHCALRAAPPTPTYTDHDEANDKTASPNANTTLAFDVRLRYEAEGLWRWKQMQGDDLGDERWSEAGRFYLA